MTDDNCPCSLCVPERVGEEAPLEMNKPLIAQVGKFVMVREELHHQGHYFGGSPIELSGSAITDAMFECSSTGCVAGWGAMIAGYHQIAVLDMGVSEWMKKEVRYATETVVDETGTEYPMHEAARLAFGFSTAQAACMFDGTRTRKELGWIFDAIEASDNPEELSFASVIADGYRATR